MKIIILLAITFAILAGASYYARSDSDNAPDETQSPYSTLRLERSELVSAVSATGSLKPLTTVQVGSQVSGTIEALYADFNSSVKKGQLIAKIEPSLIQTQVARAAANLKSAEAGLDKAKFAVRDAQRQVTRLTTLHAKHLVSESELDAARFAEEAARVDQKVQEAAVAQANAEVEQAQVNLKHTSIFAPIDGIVISRDVAVGQTLAASLQTPTLFNIAKDLTRMQIETEVDEAFIGNVHEGQPVTFTVFAYPRRNFKGTVVQVRLNPNTEAGVVKYNSIIHVDNPDLALKPGMTATVTIETARKQNVFAVPNEALRFVPEQIDPKQIETVRAKLKANEAVIWLANNGSLQPLIVQPGLIGEKQTEITGSALQTGLLVALPADDQAAKTPGRMPKGLRLF